MKITVRNYFDRTTVELNEHSRIEFGEGADRITVAVRDGIVEVSSEQRLVIQPRASNLVWVECKR